jgi:hypothetical protein
LTVLISADGQDKNPNPKKNAPHPCIQGFPARFHQLGGKRHPRRYFEAAIVDSIQSLNSGCSTTPRSFMT